MIVHHAGEDWVFTKHAVLRMVEMGIGRAELDAAMDAVPFPSKKYSGSMVYRAAPIALGTIRDKGLIIVKTILFSSEVEWKKYLAAHPEVKDRFVKNWE